ncbi:MAG: LamG domain-containing protein [Bryobacteraceae bacterium]|nr:LamG domain-containing protein [Bryobacteraceae bacterium]
MAGNGGGLNGDPDVLEGWKAIGDYFDKTPRAVQRWEREHGMPVHREFRRVYARRAELEEWRKGLRRLPEEDVQPTAAADRKAWWRGRGGVLATAGVRVIGLLVAVVAYSRWVRAPMPAPRVAERVRYLWRASAEGGAVKSIALPGQPGAMAADGVRPVVYTALEGRAGVARVDLGGGTVSVIDTPLTVRSLTVRGSRIYAGGFSSGIAVIEGDKTVDVIPTDGPVVWLAVTPDERYVFAAMVHQGARRFDLKQREWLQLTQLGCPVAVALDGRGERVLVSYQCDGPKGWLGHDSAEVFDVGSGKSVRLIHGLKMIGGYHQVTPDGRQIWFDGLDACKTERYGREGCDAYPSWPLHIYDWEKGEVVRSLFLPLEQAGSPRFIREGSRGWWAADHLGVMDLRQHKFVEAWAPKSTASLGSGVTADGRYAYHARMAKAALEVYEAQPEECAAPAEGLLHWFAADGTEHDAIAASRFGPAEALRYAPGFVGQALQVDGGARKTYLQWASEWGFGADQSTLSVWLKPERAGPVLTMYPGVVETDTNFRWWLDLDEEFRLLFAVGDMKRAEAVRGRTRLYPRQWWHVVVVHRGEGLELYVNGELAGERRPVVRAPRGGLAKVAVGWRPVNKDSYAGLVDELGFWGRAWSAEEVRDTYTRSVAPACRP